MGGLLSFSIKFLFGQVLHDVIEDTTAPIESIEFLFGTDVANLVSQLTCDDIKRLGC
jgi:(p)ppGpp synthase/HD superfamily hydrolase